MCIKQLNTRFGAQLEMEIKSLIQPILTFKRLNKAIKTMILWSKKLIIQFRMLKFIYFSVWINRSNSVVLPRWCRMWMKRKTTTISGANRANGRDHLKSSSYTSKTFQILTSQIFIILTMRTNRYSKDETAQKYTKSQGKNV